MNIKRLKLCPFQPSLFVGIIIIIYESLRSHIGAVLCCGADDDDLYKHSKLQGKKILLIIYVLRSSVKRRCIMMWLRDVYKMFRTSVNNVYGKLGIAIVPFFLV